MPRKIEGLENFNRIITLPIGSKFGLFVNSSIDAFNVTGYIDLLARWTDDPYIIRQRKRTQQRQTLKGNLMLTTTLLICIIALLIFRK